MTPPSDSPRHGALARPATPATSASSSTWPAPASWWRRGATARRRSRCCARCRGVPERPARAEPAGAGALQARAARRGARHLPRDRRRGARTTRPCAATWACWRSRPSALDEAVAELELAARLAPDDKRAWSYLGYAYARQRRAVAAAAAFRRAGQDARRRRAGARGAPAPPADGRASSGGGDRGEPAPVPPEAPRAAPARGRPRADGSPRRPRRARRAAPAGLAPAPPPLAGAAASAGRRSRCRRRGPTRVRRAAAGGDARAVPDGRRSCLVVAGAVAPAPAPAPRLVKARRADPAVGARRRRTCAPAPRWPASATLASRPCAACAGRRSGESLGVAAAAVLPPGRPGRGLGRRRAEPLAGAGARGRHPLRARGSRAGVRRRRVVGGRARPRRRPAHAAVPRARPGRAAARRPAGGVRSAEDAPARVARSAPARLGRARGRAPARAATARCRSSARATASCCSRPRRRSRWP